MKVMTILGTRPEIIRLSVVIPLLDSECDHVLVHTGQNYDDRLSRIFFEELSVRQPDVYMGVRSAQFGEQAGLILSKAETLFLENRPDRILILGDTNSGLASVIARRMGIPVYHMEAGNRCYDDRVPEEINRRIIDNCSSLLLPYTQRSRENLLAEGFPGNRIYVTGNPIKQVIERYAEQIRKSAILQKLGVSERRYVLVTAHRAENVDHEQRLRSLIGALIAVHSEFGFPVICSLHPRTRARAEAFGLDLNQAGVLFADPFGFFDFVRLEQSAFCLITDSGTVQEEACIFGVPNVTIRDVTERPETIDCGSNVLCGVSIQNVVRSVALVTRQVRRWAPPPEYLSMTVAETVCRIVLGYRSSDTAEDLHQNDHCQR